MTTRPFSGVTTDRRVGNPTKHSDRLGGLIAAISIANFGIWVTFFTPVLVTMQLRVQQLAPGNRESVLSLTLGISSVCGILSNPIAGRLSDRTTTRWGMRRPWLVCGMLIGLVGLTVEGSAGSITMLIVGACLTQIGWAIALTVLTALLPDQIPVTRRGAVAAAMGITQSLAIPVAAGVGGALSGNMLLAFVAPWVAGGIGIGILCVVLRDRVLNPADRPPLQLRSLPGTFWTSPRRHPDFAWAWISRLLLFTAFASVINYQIFYLTGQLRLPTAEATKIVTLALGGQALFVIVSSGFAGVLSDRLRRRKPFVIVAGIIAAFSLVLLATATSLPQYFMAFALAGIAQGTYFSTDLALVADVLPDRENAAKDLGVMAVANMLPQTVAPAIAPVFLSISVGSVIAGAEANYTMLYIVSAVFALLAALTIKPIRGTR